MKIRKVRDYVDPKIITDPFGSYTGNPVNGTEVPVQDVDDL